MLALLMSQDIRNTIYGKYVKAKMRSSVMWNVWIEDEIQGKAQEKWKPSENVLTLFNYILSRRTYKFMGEETHASLLPKSKTFW
jgi:hypothetical protein